MTPDQLIGNPAWPFGQLDRQSPTYAAVLAATISDRFTVLDTELTGNCTLNLTINSDVPDGSLLFLKIKADADNYNLTPGTGFVAPAIVGANTKTKTQLYVLVDGIFIPSSGQIN